MLGGTDMDGPLRAVKLCARFQEIECRADVGGRRGGPGLLVVPLPQPTAKTLAADGPGFAVIVDWNIGKGGATGGMKIPGLF